MLTKFDINGIMVLVREYASLHVQAHILAHVKNQDLYKDYTVEAQKIHDQIRDILTAYATNQSVAQAKIDAGYPMGYANLHYPEELMAWRDMVMQKFQIIERDLRNLKDHLNYD